MSGFDHFKEEVRHRLTLLSVATGYGVAFKKSGADQMLGLCPFHGEKSPSFRIYTATNRYHCFGCGRHGDIFEFIQEIDSGATDFKSALKIAAGHAGLSDTNFQIDPALAARREKAFKLALVKREALEVKKTQLSNNKITQIRNMCLPAKGSIVEDYLRSRYINGEALEAALKCLKYCPTLPYYNSNTRQDMGKYGAMVGYITNASRSIIGIHATYLSPDGTKLRLFDDGDKPLPCKKMYGKFMDGVVPLCKVDDVLCLAEGIETAISATILRGRPTWSVCSSANFATLAIPPRVKTIYLMLDQGSKDENGYRNTRQKAALKLSKRGFEVRGGWPAYGDDFNHMLKIETTKNKEATL